MNLPNRLTVARLILVPIFVALMSIDNTLALFIAYLVFVTASITDYLDGSIARSRNLITSFGKLMDPLADKILMASAFIMVMTIPELRIPPWTLVAIFAREFLVTGARSLAASDGVVISANWWGKMKTIFQMTYVCAFLLFYIAARYLIEHSYEWAIPYMNYIGIGSQGAIILVALYTAASGIQFAVVNWNTLRLGASS
jgi:CDP-diacylglycerol--glycerol-3-phosphate 3-phosphatidyltransferase